MRQSWITLTIAIAATAAYLFAPPLRAQEAPRFVFLGDMPYDRDQEIRLRQKIGPAILKGGFPFVVHYGDIKAGKDACTDKRILDAHRDIHTLWQPGDLPAGTVPPIFYTPGDNEWTDCDRTFSNGASRSELERLDFLRRVFFFAPRQAPTALAPQRQPLYPENAIWRSGKVLFATLHMVGTRNGWAGIDSELVSEKMAFAQIEARDQANRVWLKKLFKRAQAAGSAVNAVIIATQADVTKASGKPECGRKNRKKCDAFAGFRKSLIKRAKKFGKPVLLLHGDTNPYCLEAKFGGDAAPNLWRLNAGGDYHLPLDATVVTVDTADPAAPFKVRGLVDGEAPGVCAR